MKLPARGRGSSARPVEAPEEVGPAIRDAETIARRAESDEAQATTARRRLARGPIPVLDADIDIAPHLASNEVVHALRKHAVLRRPGADRAHGSGGTLYLTSRRLMHLGEEVVIVPMTDIEEVALAGEALLLTTRGGEGLSLELDRPRLLRAEMAATLRRLRR